MEACQESSPAPAGPVQDRHVDLTEDLDQQLEDILSTYQEAQLPAEPDDPEEVTAAKEPDARKEQKLEKKMLKNLGGFSYSQNASLVLAEVGRVQLKVTLQLQSSVCRCRERTAPVNSEGRLTGSKLGEDLSIS